MWGAPSEDEAAPDALAGSQPRSPDADMDGDDNGSTRSVQTALVPAAPVAAPAGQNGAVAPMDWAVASAQPQLYALAIDITSSPGNNTPKISPVGASCLDQVVATVAYKESHHMITLLGGGGDQRNGAAPAPDVGLDDFEALLASVGIPTSLAGKQNMTANCRTSTASDADDALQEHQHPLIVANKLFRPGVERSDPSTITARRHRRRAGADASERRHRRRRRDPHEALPAGQQRRAGGSAAARCPAGLTPGLASV